MSDKIMKEILTLQKMVLKMADKLDSVAERMDEMEFLLSSTGEEVYDNDSYDGWEQIEDYHQDFLDEYEEEDDDY